MAQLSAAVLLLLLPLLPAHREGLASGSHLSTESGVAAAEAAYHANMHKKMVECQGAKSEVHGQSQESMQKAERCINAIASFAQTMQKQREKSLKANRNYKDDIVLAKKVLRFLTKQTDAHQQDFEHFKQTEKQHLDDIHKMLRDREAANQQSSSMVQQQMDQENLGPLAQDFYRSGSPGSYPGSYLQMPMQTPMQPPMPFQMPMQNPMSALQMQIPMQMPMSPMQRPIDPMSALQMQSADVAVQGNMAAMFSPSGQNLRLPRGMVEAGMVGRRPSLLQLGGMGSGASMQSAADTDAFGLQARLDKEAEKLEEADERDLQGNADD